MQTFLVPGSRFPVPRWFLMLASLASASPVSAAVTLRGIVPEDGPRAGWFERYTEARQGPEQVEKFTQSYKVGDGAALDLSQLSGDIRVTGGRDHSRVSHGSLSSRWCVCRSFPKFHPPFNRPHCFLSR